MATAAPPHEAASAVPEAYWQRLTLWYDRPAGEWNEALPVGNGRLGAMVFGGVKTERLQLNEDTLWSGAPHDYNAYGAWRRLPEVRTLIFEGYLDKA
jgi:alpha-L-fucosidase 2